MTKAELIDDIAKRSNLSRAQAKLAVETFVVSVTDSLRRGEQVRIVGFGVFTPVDRAAGIARNPRTGAKVKKPASKSARFRVGDALRSALN
jgi:DNA-binding protein HU-beta